jgi:WD40 repeat protein
MSWSWTRRTAWRQHVEELETARTAAERAAVLADARRLAGASELSTATIGPGGALALVLATESIRKQWTLEGDIALRHALRTAPRLVADFPVDERGMGTLRLTPSGDRVVRSLTHVNRQPKTVRRWTQLLAPSPEGTAGRVVHEDDVSAVQFTHDGSAVLRADSRRVTVAELRTGATLAEDVDDDKVVSAILSDNGKLLVVIRGQESEEDRNQVVRDARISVTDLATSVRRRASFLVLRGELTFNADCTLLAAMVHRYDEAAHRWMAVTTVFDLVGKQAQVECRHDGEASGRLVFSPDRTLLAAGVNTVDSCGDSHSGGIEVFDLLTPDTRLFRHERDLPVKALAFDPSSTRLAVAVGDWRRRLPGAGHLFEARTGRELHRTHHEDPVQTTGFTTDGTRVFFAGTRSARVHSVRDGDELFRVDHEQDLAGVMFALDDRRLVTLTGDHTGRGQLFESRGAEITRLDYDHGRTEATISADGTTAFLCEPEIRTRAIDTRTGAERAVLAHEKRSRVVGTSADGALVLIESEVEARVQDVRDGSAPFVLRHDEPLAAWLTLDGSRVVTVAGQRGRDSVFTDSPGLVQVTDLRSGTVLSAARVTGQVRAVSHDGASAAVALSDEDDAPTRDFKTTQHGRFAIVTTADGAERGSFRARMNWSSVCFDPRGQWVIILCDQLVVSRRIADGTPLWIVDVGFEACRVFADPTGSFLAVADLQVGRQGTLAIVDARTGTLCAAHDANGRGDPAFSADGRRIAFVHDRAAHVADVSTGALLCVVDHESEVIDHVDFAGHDGSRLVTGDRRSLRVSEVHTTALLAEAATRLARELTAGELRKYL